MLKADFYRVIGGIIIGITILIGTLAAVQLLSQTPLWSTEGSGWVGAIGTVGTLIGTIWLATAEARRRKAQEAARGFIVAASLAPRLDMLSHHIGAFSGRLEFSDWEGMQQGTAHQEASGFLSFAYTPATTDELIALESMPLNCATKLAYAQAQLVIVRDQIRYYLENVAHPERPLPTKIAKIWAEWAEDLRNRVDVLERQFRDAARAHAAPPTHSELYGDDFE